MTQTSTGFRNDKKIVLAAAFLFAMWFGGLLNEWLFVPNVGVVLLSNESSEAITSAQVSVCGQTFDIVDVPAGKFAVVRYDVAFDSHYEIKVSFQSGRMMENEIGYVMNGSDFLDVIEITDSEIVHAGRELPDRQ